MSEAMTNRDEAIAKKGRIVALVIAGAMVFWIGGQFLRSELEMPLRFAFDPAMQRSCAREARALSPRLRSRRRSVPASLAQACRKTQFSWSIRQTAKRLATCCRALMASLT